MNDKVMASPTSKKKYKTWVKSSRNDEWTKEIRVEEIENGFLVCLDEYGERKGKYESHYKKYFAWLINKNIYFTLMQYRTPNMETASEFGNTMSLFILLNTWRKSA